MALKRENECFLKEKRNKEREKGGGKGREVLDSFLLAKVSKSFEQK